MRPLPPLAPPSKPCLTSTLPRLISTSPTLREHNSRALRPVSTRTKMSAWSRLAVGRRMTYLWRILVSASRVYRQALSIRSTSSWVNGSTVAFLIRGGGTSFIGFAILNSWLAQLKNEDRVIHTLRMDLGERGWVLPFNRSGVYSVRSQVR